MDADVGKVSFNYLQKSKIISPIKMCCVFSCFVTSSKLLGKRIRATMKNAFRSFCQNSVLCDRNSSQLYTYTHVESENLRFVGSSEKLLSVTKQLCCHVLNINHAPRPIVDHGLYINIIFRCYVLGKQENKICCNSCVHFLKNRLSLCVLIVLGKMRSAIGSAQLLISQKFQQFRELCEENLVSLKHPYSLLFTRCLFIFW